MKARVIRLAAFAVTLLVPAAAQVAILQIRFVDGEGAVRAPGRHVVHPLVVEIDDESGKALAGAAVSFHLAEDGSGGAFPNGLHTDVVATDAQGRAAMPPMRVGHAPGPFQIRVVAVKEQARAGAVATQYVAEPHSGAASAGSTRGKARWLAILAAVGGGTAAGVLSAARKTPAASSTPPPAAVAGAPSPVTIGAPASTVGKP